MRAFPLAAATAAILIPFAGGAAAQTGPSFDCDEASTATEVAICGSARLSSLEMSMFQAFEGLEERVGAREARRIADELLVERQACRGDATCIETTLTVSAGVFGTVGTTTDPSLGEIIQAERARREAEPQFGTDMARVGRPVPRPQGIVDGRRVAREAAAQGPTAPATALRGAAAPQDGQETSGTERVEPFVPATPQSPLGQVFSILPSDERIEVERNLAGVGLPADEVDGVWSEATDQALREVQREASGDGSNPMDAVILLDFVGSEAFRDAHAGEEASMEFLPVAQATEP